jgi:hypothetical protein
MIKRLTPEEYYKVCNEDYIGRVKFIKPNLGDNHFGYFDCEFLTPEQVQRQLDLAEILNINV